MTHTSQFPPDYIDLLSFLSGLRIKLGKAQSGDKKQFNTLQAFILMRKCKTRSRQPLFPFILLIIFITLSSRAAAEPVDLFIMAGQSNMQGWRSDAAQYPADPQGLDSKIPFYYEAVSYGSSEQRWSTLNPQLGHFQTGHFGPEVSFARAVLRAGYKPAVFKFSSGGSNLKSDWKSPGQNGLYDEMVSQLKQAINLLESQGFDVRPAAFIWIQGESDAFTDQLANEYYWNLKRLIHHMRHNVIRKPDLPVILSLDEQHPRVMERPKVVDAQKKLAGEDSTIRFFSMKGLEKSDVTHLTAGGTINQGKRLFDAFRSL